jgi:opacity protein-like surface antigen
VADRKDATPRDSPSGSYIGTKLWFPSDRLINGLATSHHTFDSLLVPGNRRPATVCARNAIAGEETKMKANLLLVAIVWILVAAPTVRAQKGIEITPFIGGQTNGGLDISTTLFKRIDVQNGLNYGVSAGYLIGKNAGVEFMWNHNQAGTLAQPISGGPDQKVFNLNTNQYLGDFVMHFKDRESRLRPFVLFGAGVSNLSPDRSDVRSITRFAWVFAGGAKYNFSKRLGLRLQAKWSPTYITTTTTGYWCDPFWGGCWAQGDTHFLQEFDATAGLTLRF